MKKLGLAAVSFVISSVCVSAQPPAPVALTIDAARITARVSPTLYGLMTEEINYSYDGGLYGELVRNRTFQDNADAPEHWSLVQEGGGTGAIALDRSQPLNAELPVSLKLEVTTAASGARVGVANDGFWGIPVKSRTAYRASFYAKASAGFSGPLMIAIERTDGSAAFASATVTKISGVWKKYSVTLKTGEVGAPLIGRLVISAKSPGTVWLDLVSLFPPTWRNRSNGNRPDLMQLLADMKPAFLRFPGGNYVQGRTLATRFPWQKSLGDLAERSGHLNDSWKYRSSDGMGLLEFLEWCEDLKMEPVLAVFAGLTLDRQNQKPVPAGPELQPYVQEALDEIEYVIGDTKTPWGARRAKDGHRDPFPLNYVEIGNEDFFDRTPGSYDARFAQFFDAIRGKYPPLKIVATTKVTSRVPDVIDDHYYKSAKQFQADVHHYDASDRNGPKIMVGEWATREGEPTPNLGAALGDAAWMTGMERNSDLIVMSCYAPLFVNVNPGGMQWRTDLIGYDALTSYGSPAYYAQKIFSLNHGDAVLAAAIENIPAETWQPPKPRNSEVVPPTQQVPTFFTNVTRDTKSGTVFVKLVNTSALVQPVRIEVKGAKSVAPDGEAITLSGSAPTETNSITEPTKILPVESKVGGLAPIFTRELAPYSITVLKLRVK